MNAMEMTQEQRDEVPCFVATCSGCGRVVGAAADTPERKKETASAVSSWIRSGLDIAKMLPPEVRSAAWGHAKECPKAGRKRNA